MHNQIVPDLTTIEVGPEGVDGEVVEGLKERGHKIGEFDVNIGISEGGFFSGGRGGKINARLMDIHSASDCGRGWTYICVK